jgi:nucleoside-diphosphate-sugar epimerase
VRVLLIGGTRCIGAWVARQFLARGDDVSVFHRGEHESAVVPPEVRHIHSDRAAWPVTHFPPELFSPAPPDVVVHMMAMGEEDAVAAVSAFRGRARRLVVISSGDVYRAYGKFARLECGPVEPMPLTEDSPLRTALFPYRKFAVSPGSLEYAYEKILVEQVVMSEPELPATVLRLGKVYGREDNSDLATVRSVTAHPEWRWTHAYVENVAAAIVLAATHSHAANRIYNVGEEHTPTVAERLRDLPNSAPTPPLPGDYDFEQDVVLSSERIRRELGFREIVSYEEGLRRTFAGAATP